MASKKITECKFFWRQGLDKGKVALKLEGGSKGTISDIDAAEFTALLALFEHRPLFFDTETKIVSSRFLVL